MFLKTRLQGIRSSFQLQLFSLFTLLTAGITLVFVTLFVAKEVREMHCHASEKLQLVTEAFANSVKLPLYAENTDILRRYAEETLHLPEMRAVQIYAANGKPLVLLGEVPQTSSYYLSRSFEVRTPPLAPLPGSGLEGEGPTRGSLIGEVRLYRGTDDLGGAARRLIATACAFALAFWLLVSFSCYLLLRRVTRSFQALMRGLENIRGGDYVSRIEVFSDDEPGRASAAVNQLAESLGQRDEENRRLTAELREAMALEVASKERQVALNAILEEEVAERLRAKQELKNLVEQLPLGIVWSDAQGRIEYLNRFMLERIGYGFAEVRSVEDWLLRACPDPVRRERVAAQRRRAIDAWQRAGEVSFYDFQVVGKDGTVRDLTCSNQLSGGRTVDIMIDMTERELLQQQIIRNQKLESIGVLAGGIAHNFNNALTGVIGYISFAKKFLDPAHRVYELMLHAERASKRASGLASQLLTFASGGAPVRKVVSIAKLVEESASLATTGSRVARRLVLPQSLHNVYVDDGQICQAFNCICINAVQAMPEGGVLTVRARNVSTEVEKLPVARDGEYVELSFEDQGSGIREEDRCHIFTPYFTTKAEVGTGLGLATAHSIITRHGGAITFVSALGKGTTFTVYLPAVRKAVSEAQPEERESAGFSEGAGGASILVMDDEETIRNFARDVLEEQGYQVTLCANGQEAMVRYRTAYEAGAPFQAAILDLTVPGAMGGKETAQQILALHPQARLVVSSGYSNDVVMAEYREYGFCAAYAKPYDAVGLSRLLGEIGVEA